MKHSVPRSLAALAAVGVLVSGGCSGGGGGGGGGGITNPPPSVVEVHATSTNQFSPSSVTISRGMTVRWTADSNSGHTVTPNDASQAGAWSSTNIATQGATFEFTFGTAGDFNYHCITHSGMTGVVHVQ